MITLTKSDEVWTQDDYRLGHPNRLFHRTDGIDPDLELYADYVHVMSFDLGDDFYIPTDFIDGRNPENGRITLTVPMETVLKNTWNRIPDFVVHKEAQAEELPGKIFE